MLSDVDAEMTRRGYGAGTTDLDRRLDLTHARPLPFNDIEYADDTILVTTLLEHARTLLHEIQHRSAEDNMTLNADKSEHLSVRGPGNLQDFQGVQIPQVSSALYLGSGIHAARFRSNRSRLETSRRLAMANDSYHRLSAIWGHSSISTRRKKVIYRACVVSKLLYGLQTIAMTKADLTRLDAFHARCLRKILRIPTTYAAKKVLHTPNVVTNAEVLRRAREYPLSVDLTNLQIRHYAHLVRLDIYDPLRQVTLHADTDAKPPNWKGRRPSGAPPKAWVTEAAARTRETYRLSAPHTPFSAQEYHDFLRNALAVRKATHTRRELARTACQHSTTLQDILSLASTRTASLSKPDTDSTKFIDHTNPLWGPNHLLDPPPPRWWPTPAHESLNPSKLVPPDRTLAAHLYYTDGSATRGRQAGWGYVHFEDAHLRTEKGGAVLADSSHPDWCGARTHTNNTAEITAMVQVFKHALTAHPADALELRYDSCLAAGLAQSRLIPHSNHELVATLRHLVILYEKQGSVKFTHVRAHRGEWWNERVDSLANHGATRG